MLDRDAPFAVANDRRRFVWQLVGGVAMTVFMGLLVSQSGGEALPLIGVGVGVAMVVLALLSLRHRDPLMTADHTGVDLRAFRGPDGVRRFAWEEIEAIYPHRISKQFRMLCVRPRDLEAERAWAGEKRGRVMDGSVKRVGAPYSVNLVPAGIPDDVALTTLRALAKGRATVGERPRP